MLEQSSREDVSAADREQARRRLDTLFQQHDDLSGSLTQLLQDLLAGQRRLKVYRQLKMYNDPAMNPFLYRARARAAA
jgi:hypothetical protein